MSLNEKQLIERLHPRPVRYFSQIGSTNDVALEWMINGAAEGSTVGITVGITVGSSDGTAVGTTVGTLVGLGV